MQRVDPALVDWDVQQGCMCERAERREEEGRNNYGGGRNWAYLLKI